MRPIYDDLCTGTISAASNNGTCSHTVAADGNEILLVCVSVNNGNFETVSTITYNSVSLTKLDSYAQGDDGLVELWYLYGPDTGSSYTVSVTMSANLEQAAVFAAVSFSNAHQTAAFGTVAKNNSVDEGDESFAEVIISSASDQTVIGFYSGDNHWDTSTVAGGTERWDTQHGTASGAGATADGDTSVTMTWTPDTGSDSWAAIGVGIKPPSADISSRIKRRLLRRATRQGAHIGT